jgi:arylsulfatase A-like enzyme
MNDRESVLGKTFAVALWFGLLAGLVEGVALWGLQRLGWLTGPLTFLGFLVDIVWISVVFDVVLFLLVGLALTLLARLVPRAPILTVSIFSFAFLVSFDWLVILLLGHIRIWAIPFLAAGLAVQITRLVNAHRLGVVHFIRRSTRWLALSAVLLLIGVQGGHWLLERLEAGALPDPSLESPNVLVIVVDTLRADHLSTYGYPRDTSPVIDQIAAEGALFETAYATSSWTQPSHASMLTGRYPYEHLAELYRPLDDSYPTVAEALQSRGYRTGAFSANVRVFCQRLGFGRGFQHFEDYYQSLGNVLVNTALGRVFEFYFLHLGLGLEDEIGRLWSEDINQNLLRWVDQDSDKPFFVFVNYMDVHDPYVPPEPYRSRFSQSETPGGRINSYWGVDGIYVPMTPEQLQGEIDAYDGAISYVDYRIGQLFEELERRDLTDNLLLFITSDHGESFGEHGLLQHTNSLYREVIHVPLIIWWPGHVPQGVRAEQPVTIAAIPATLMELLGSSEPGVFPGPALTELWTDDEPLITWPDPIAELARHPWMPTQNPSAHGAERSVLDTEWQYMTHETFGEQLYYLPADPQEESNVVGNLDVSPVVESFRMYLQERASTYTADEIASGATRGTPYDRN